MAGASGLDGIIKQMLSADNESRQAAEAAFNEAKKNPDGLVGNLMQVLRASSEAESRAFSAVMLRKVSTLHWRSEQSESGTRLLVPFVITHRELSVPLPSARRGWCKMRVRRPKLGAPRDAGADQRRPFVVAEPVAKCEGVTHS